MVSELPRSRSTRALAERTLATFLSHLGSHKHDVVVIGGLNPDLLTERPPAPHLGTTDVDLLLEVGFVYDRDDLDFAWLEIALTASGFAPAIAGSGWRWSRKVDGVPVLLELLCDTPDNRGQELALPGCDRATAMNLSGPAPALTDTRLVELPVPPGDRSATVHDFVQGRFAGLGGYLLAKSAAVVGRRLAKDYYDLAYVMLYNPGGPRAAAHAVASALPEISFSDHEGELRAALRSFEGAESTGTLIFVEQMREAGAVDEGEFFAQDIVIGATEFLEELERVRNGDPH